MARAMLTAAALVPSYFLSTPESLALNLSMRALGADAASEALADARERKPTVEKPGAPLDPMYHADQADEAVRKLVLDPYTTHQQQLSNFSQGTVLVGGAITQPQPQPQPQPQLPPLPSPELYARLMDVFDAAGLPLRAADLALRVLGAELPICVSSSQQGTAAETRPADGGAGSAAGRLQEGMLAVVADAMRLSNEASFYRVSTLLFQEALLRGGGKISHAGVVEQVSGRGSVGGRRDGRAAENLSNQI